MYVHCARKRIIITKRTNSIWICGTLVLALLSGCASWGPVYHQPSANFAHIKDGNHLKKELSMLRTTLNDDQFAIAKHLAKNGASCAFPPANAVTDKSKMGIVCTYFFCDGNVTQQFHWNLNINSIRNDEKYDATWINYGWVGSIVSCSKKGELRRAQDAFMNQHRTAIDEF